MGKPTGFMEFNRETPTKRKVEERVKDYPLSSVIKSINLVQLEAFELVWFNKL